MDPGRWTRNGAPPIDSRVTGTGLREPRSASPNAVADAAGGTPLIELYVVFAAVAQWLSGHGMCIARSLVGNYITSLEMAGTSVTVCRLIPELADLWDAPVEAPALRWGR